MADIFDTITPASSAPAGDIFDEVTGPAAAGDIFDAVAPAGRDLQQSVLRAAPPKPLRQTGRELLAPLIGETANQTAQRIGGDGQAQITIPEMVRRYGAPRALAKVASVAALEGPAALLEAGARNLVRTATGQPLVAPTAAVPEQPVGPATPLRSIGPHVPKTAEAGLIENVAGTVGHAAGMLPGFIGTAGLIGAGLKWPEVVRQAAAGSVTARLLLRAIGAGLTGAGAEAASGGSLSETLKSGALTAPLGPLGAIGGTPGRVAAMAGYGAAVPAVTAAATDGTTVGEHTPDIIAGAIFNGLLGLLSHGQRNPFAPEFKIPLAEVGRNGEPLRDAKTGKPVLREMTGAELGKQLAGELQKAGLDARESQAVVERMGRLTAEGLGEQAQAEYMAAISKARRTQTVAPAPAGEAVAKTIGTTARGEPGESRTGATVGVPPVRSPGPVAPAAKPITPKQVEQLAAERLAELVPALTNFEISKYPSVQTRADVVRGMIQRGDPQAEEQARQLNQHVGQLQQQQATAAAGGVEGAGRYEVTTEGNLTYLRDKHTSDVVPGGVVPKADVKGVARLRDRLQALNGSDSFDQLAINHYLTPDEQAQFGQPVNMTETETGRGFINRSSSSIQGRDNALIAKARQRALDALNVAPEDPDRRGIDRTTQVGHELRASFLPTLQANLQRGEKQRLATAAVDEWQAIQREHAGVDQADLPAAVQERLAELEEKIPKGMLDQLTKVDAPTPPAAPVQQPPAPVQQPAAPAQQPASPVEQKLDALKQQLDTLQQTVAGGTPPKESGATSSSEPPVTANLETPQKITEETRAPAPAAASVAAPAAEPRFEIRPREKKGGFFNVYHDGVNLGGALTIEGARSHADKVVAQYVKDKDLHRTEGAPETPWPEIADLTKKAPAAASVATRLPARIADATPAQRRAEADRIFKDGISVAKFDAHPWVIEAREYVAAHSELVLDPSVSTATGAKWYADHPATQFDRVLWYILGLPGAGKSRVVADELVKQSGAFLADSDPIKKTLDGYANGMGAGLVHDASSHIIHAAIDAAIAAGANIVLPVIGADAVKAKENLQKFTALGYTVNIVEVGVSPDTSRARALARYMGGGQGFIDRKQIEKYGLNPSVTFATLQQENEYDSYHKFDNDTVGQDPQTVYTSDRSRIPEVVRRSGGEGGRGSDTEHRRAGGGAAATEGLTDEQPPTQDAGEAARLQPRVRNPIRPGGSGEVLPAESRSERSDAGGAGDRVDAGRTGDVARPADDEVKTEGDQLSALSSPPATETTPANVGNYRIADLEYLQRGGAKTKFKNNVAAIETLRGIQAEGRAHATLEEQHALAQWTGWGQFPQVFDEKNADWNSERAALRKLLPTTEHWDAAKRSTLNAHYTDPRIAAALWKMVQRLGFPRGRVLEAGMGSGIFFGTMPAELHDKSALTGVELDPTTGALAKLLYPQANVQVKGFQDFQSPNNFFDLNIGNYPFADITIVSDRDYRKLQPVLHDYFLLKAVDKVRPGGLVATITSTYTLDKLSPRIREEIDKKAELVAAYRLPGGAFQKNAGTAVVTDLLLFRRWLPDERPHNESWLNLGTLPDPDGGAAIPVNEYYVSHPENILGTLDRNSRMYGRGKPNVSLTADFRQRLEAAIERLPQDIYTSAVAKAQFVPETASAAEETKPGGFEVQNGKLFVKDPKGGQLVEQKASAGKVALVRDALKVRNALRAVIAAELQGASDEDVKHTRTRLNQAYDTFAGKHGPFWVKKNATALKADPDAPNLFALERRDPKTGLTKKADIFTKRTVRGGAVATKPTSVTDALSQQLNQTGRISPTALGKLLDGRTGTDIAGELVAKGLAYLDPSGGWQAAAEYLSGNVRRKLLEAQEAAAADPKFQANIAALEKVQPPDRDYAEIDVRLGAGWVPAEDVGAFAAHLLGGAPGDVAVKYVENLAKWIVEYSNDGERTLKGKPVATEVWGTPRADFVELLQAALDGATLRITDPGRQVGERVPNAEATADAAAKQEQIKQAFKDWIWEDDARRNRLAKLYNETNNGRVIYKPDGAHLTFPGMATHLPNGAPIQFMPHQKNGVWRIITKGSALLAHEVGTGKTWTMVAAAMELKRLGLANKPAIAVPKAVLPGFLAELRALYPNARVLTTDGKFDRAKRQATVSQIATGDWDMVLLTHDNLNMLPMSPDVQREFITSELTDLVHLIMEAADAEGSSSRIVKQLEKAKSRLEEKLKAALEGENDKDTNTYFEHTGIDALFVDEAHKYKALAVHTAGERVKGIPTALSQRAANMFMRTQWLQKMNNGRGIVFATGTPVANTMAELFTMQRYLQMPELEAQGMRAFDAWKANFGEVESAVEPSVTGKYDVVSRFAKFSNLPELLQLARDMMDVVFADDSGVPIVRPKKIQKLEVTDMSDLQRSFMDTLQRRAELMKQTKIDPSVDNMLKVSTDGRKMALDTRLLSAGVADYADSKVNHAVANVLRIHRENPGKTQMIFSDLGQGTTAWGFSLVKDLTAKLVKGGIPADKIINFSDLTETEKLAAARRLWDGDALIGMGSTDTLGTGVNAQQHLLAVHHLDAPWMPAHVEQRDGRIWRQGNLNSEITVHRYITKGSFDAFLWNLLDRKAKFIRQVMKGDVNQREVIDEDTDALTYEQIKAIATGNPDMVEFVRLGNEVKQLEAASKRYQQGQIRGRGAIQQTQRDIVTAQEAVASMQEDVQQAAATADKPFSVTIQKRTYTDRKDAGFAFYQTFASLRPSDGMIFGEYRGFKLIATPKSGEGEFVLAGVDGTQTYPVQMSQTGTVASMDGVLRNLPKRLERQQAQVTSLQSSLDRLGGDQGKAFPQAAALADSRQRLAAVEARLRHTGDAEQQPPATAAEGRLAYGNQTQETTTDVQTDHEPTTVADRSEARSDLAGQVSGTDGDRRYGRTDFDPPQPARGTPQGDRSRANGRALNPAIPFWQKHSRGDELQQLAEFAPQQDVVGQTIEDTSDLVVLLRPLLHNHFFETLAFVMLNDAGEVVGYKDYAGGANQIVVNLPDALRFAAHVRETAGATQTVMVHNHPSDEWDTSNEDVKLTKRAAAALQTAGVPLREHVVLGANGYAQISPKGEASGLPNRTRETSNLEGPLLAMKFAKALKDLPTPTVTALWLNTKNKIVGYSTAPAGTANLAERFGSEAAEAGAVHGVLLTNQTLDSESLQQLKTLAVDASKRQLYLTGEGFRPVDGLGLGPQGDFVSAYAGNRWELQPKLREAGIRETQTSVREKPTPYGDRYKIAERHGRLWVVDRNDKLVKPAHSLYSGTPAERGRLEQWVKQLNAVAAVDDLDAAQPGTVAGVATALTAAVDGPVLLPKDAGIQGVVARLKSFESAADGAVPWIGVKRLLGQPHEFLKGVPGVSGTDVWHLKKLHDATTQLAKERVLATWGIRFLNPEVVDVLRKIPYLDDGKIAAIGRAVLQVPRLAQNLGVPQARQQILFRTAEAVRGFKTDGTPLLGTMVNPRDLTQGWRYSPDEAAALWGQLNAHERTLVKTWDARRSELASKEGLTVSLEGYMRRYHENQGSVQRLVEQLKASNPLAGKIAGFRKARKNATGYMEDFQRAVVQREIESELERRHNEFVRELELKIARPVEPRAGQHVLYGVDADGAAVRYRLEKIDDQGFLTLRQSGEQALRVAPEQAPLVRLAAGEALQAGQLRDGEVTTRREHGPFAGEMVAIDKTTHEWFKEFLTKENPAARGAFANFLWGKDGPGGFARAMLTYWKLNQLSLAMGTAATNAISNSIFHAAMTAHDLFTALAQAARAKGAPTKEVGAAFRQVVRDLMAPVEALTPAGVRRSPAPIYGAKSPASLQHAAGLTSDRGGLRGLKDELLGGQPGTESRGVVQRTVDVAGGALAGVAAGGLVAGAPGAVAGAALGAVFGLAKQLEAGMVPFAVIENYIRRITYLSQVQDRDPEFINKLLDGTASVEATRQLNRAFDSLRVWQIDYGATPLFVKKLGEGSVPFIRYIYGYVRQITNLLPVGQNKDAAQKIAGLLTLLTLAYVLQAAIQWLADRQQKGAATLGKGNVDENAPARFQAAGRQFAGKTAAGEEVFARTTKYPYLNLWPLLAGAVDDLRHGEFKNTPAELQTLGQEGISPGPSLQGVAWAFGYRQPFDTFKEPAEIAGGDLSAFVPFHRLNEYRNQLAQAKADAGKMFLTKPKGFWGNLETGLPPELRNVRPTEPGDRIVNQQSSQFVQLKPDVEALKQWTGINLRFLDPADYQLWQDDQREKGLKLDVNQAGRIKQFIVERTMQELEGSGKSRAFVAALYDSIEAENRRQARAAVKGIEKQIITGAIPEATVLQVAAEIAGRDKELQKEIGLLLARQLPADQNVADAKVLLRQRLVNALRTRVQKRTGPPTVQQLKEAATAAE